MSGLNEDQQNMLLFLKNMEQWVKDNPNDCDVISNVFDQALDDGAETDFFGTEGQNDPRGDFRDGEWSIVEGKIQDKSGD